MTTTTEITNLKHACDLFIAACPDPDAAMSLFVRTWALGATINDDVLDEVLDDLVLLAISAATRAGVELTLPEVLEEYGHPERAERIRQAVDSSRAAAIDRDATDLAAAEAVQAATKRALARPSLVSLARIRGEDVTLVSALLQRQAIWAGWPGGTPDE